MDRDGVRERASARGNQRVARQRARSLIRVGAHGGAFRPAHAHVHEQRRRGNRHHQVCPDPEQHGCRSADGRPDNRYYRCHARERPPCANQKSNRQDRCGTGQSEGGKAWIRVAARNGKERVRQRVSDQRGREDSPARVHPGEPQRLPPRVPRKKRRLDDEQHSKRPRRRIDSRKEEPVIGNRAPGPLHGEEDSGEERQAGAAAQDHHECPRRRRPQEHGNGP